MEERGGKPGISTVEGDRERIALLFSEEDTGQTRETGWEDFFQRFDADKAQLVSQERTRSGTESRFFRLTRRVTTPIGRGWQGRARGAFQRAQGMAGDVFRRARDSEATRRVVSGATQAASSVGETATWLGRTTWERVQDVGRLVPSVIRRRGASAGDRERPRALAYLRQQHRQADQLFARLASQPPAENQRTPVLVGETDRRRLFLELADLLAVHTILEERHFTRPCAMTTRPICWRMRRRNIST